eukprot:scaffold1077_cov253-Pinguiococcus_pyrenoidosus.AAC.8
MPNHDYASRIEYSEKYNDQDFEYRYGAEGQVSAQRTHSSDKKGGRAPWRGAKCALRESIMLTPPLLAPR